MPIHIVVLQAVLYLVLFVNLVGIVITVRARYLVGCDRELVDRIELEGGMGCWTLARWYWFFVVTPIMGYGCYLVSVGRSQALLQRTSLFWLWVVAGIIVLIIYGTGWHDVSKAMNRWAGDVVTAKRRLLNDQIDKVFILHVCLWIVATLAVAVIRFIGT